MGTFLVDPLNITKFDCTVFELELRLLWWICAAGKNGVVAARHLYNLLMKWQNKGSPFEIITSIPNLPEEMRKHGIGCYNNKAKSFCSLVTSGLNLKTCSVEDLEKVYGLGPKSSRCFLIHSRPNQMYAGLDTHILRFLGDQGHEVPKSTPSGKKYRELEKIFLGHVSKSKMTVADFDLKIWREYRNA